jgi:cysteine-rich repeat protein
LGHSDITEALDDFNSGDTGPGHCGDNEEPCGEESCDGGCEPPPVCGNGVVETGETCDDGNTWSGDGCSSSCTC